MRVYVSVGEIKDDKLNNQQVENLKGFIQKLGEATIICYGIEEAAPCFEICMEGEALLIYTIAGQQGHFIMVDVPDGALEGAEPITLLKQISQECDFELLVRQLNDPDLTLKLTTK